MFCQGCRSWGTCYGSIAQAGDFSLRLYLSSDCVFCKNLLEVLSIAICCFMRQVMPFLLRRTKDEVLSDLPEKIIQDRYCDLSPVQLKLYEQFSGSHVRQEISTIVKSDESGPSEGNVASPKASSHVFQVIFNVMLCTSGKDFGVDISY